MLLPNSLLMNAEKKEVLYGGLKFVPGPTSFLIVCFLSGAFHHGSILKKECIMHVGA